MTRTRFGSLLVYVGACVTVLASPAGIDLAVAMSVGLCVAAIGAMIAAPRPPKRIAHASEIVEFPDTIGRMLQGDLVVLAPRPKTNARHGADENNLFIVAHTIGGSTLRTVVSLATGEAFAVQPDRRCCRVNALLEVTSAAER